MGTSIVRCEYCRAELFDHADCYQRTKNYILLINFVKKLRKKSCDMIDDCTACDALSILREIGEEK